MFLIIIIVIKIYRTEVTYTEFDKRVKMWTRYTYGTHFYTVYLFVSNYQKSMVLIQQKSNSYIWVMLQEGVILVLSSLRWWSQAQCQIGIEWATRAVNNGKTTHAVPAASILRPSTRWRLAVPTALLAVLLACCILKLHSKIKHACWNIYADYKVVRSMFVLKVLRTWYNIIIIIYMYIRPVR